MFILLVVSSRCISQHFFISTNFKPEPTYSMTIGWGWGGCPIITKKNCTNLKKHFYLFVLSVLGLHPGCRLSLVGVSLQWLLLLWGAGSRARTQYLQHVDSVAAERKLWSVGSIVVVCGLSCFLACGIFPDQVSNSCSLHWQVDSLPPNHQGSPNCTNFISGFTSNFLN